MSKRNMLLGLAAGKVGDLVFYRDGGEQRTRTRVIPKNPRSPRQMAQRVKIANVSATYRLLADIIEASFPNRKSNQSGYNAFAKDAISMSPYMAKSAKNLGAVIPAPYTISRGSLASVDSSIAALAGTQRLSMMVGGLSGESNTVADVSVAILAAYPALQNGDVLTFCLVELAQFVNDGIDVTTPAYKTVEQFVIDTTSDASISTSKLVVEDEFLSLNATTDETTVMGTVVVSRVDGSGRLDVNSATLKLSNKANDFYQDAVSEEAMFTAIQSYGVGEQSILRD